MASVLANRVNENLTDRAPSAVCSDTVRTDQKKPQYALTVSVSDIEKAYVLDASLFLQQEHRMFGEQVRPAFLARLAARQEPLPLDL